VIDLTSIENLKTENKKLCHYISLISYEIEFTKRVSEIKSNFEKSSESERLIVTILDRILNIQLEKESLKQELHLE